MKKILIFIILGLFLLSNVSALQQTQEINLTSGVNEVVFNVLPEDNSRENVLIDIDGEYSQIKTFSNNKIYTWAETLPSFAIDLFEINMNQTYLIS